MREDSTWRWCPRTWRRLPPPESRKRIETLDDFLSRGGKVQQCPPAETEALRTHNRNRPPVRRGFR